MITLDNIFDKTPMFEHNCKKCKFLGRFYYNSREPMGDAYICNNTVILRLSSEPRDYGSMDIRTLWSDTFKAENEIPLTALFKCLWNMQIINLAVNQENLTNYLGE